jgi:hypothetical protein
LQRASKVARGGRLATLLDNRQEGFEIVQPFHVDAPPFAMLYHKSSHCVAGIAAYVHLI